MFTTQPLTEAQADKQWQNIYRIGGVTTIIALIGILLDVIIGTATGGDLSALPKTAADRFLQLNENAFLGLYNLDLLNIINQLFLIPAYFALYAAHRHVNIAQAGLALIIFLVGSIIFITTNTAFPMLELSDKYSVSTTETQRTIFVAAGEAMLARGEHGSFGVFLGFLLPNIAGIMMSLVMLRGRVFSKWNAYLGLVGSTLMVVYVILVTCAPAVQEMATAFAAPGGLLSMAWMILFTVKLFQISKPIS